MRITHVLVHNMKPLTFEKGLDGRIKILDFYDVRDRFAIFGPYVYVTLSVDLATNLAENLYGGTVERRKGIIRDNPLLIYSVSDLQHAIHDNSVQTCSGHLAIHDQHPFR